MSIFASLDRKRVVTAVVVMAIAFVTGHVMQSLVNGEPTATLEDAPDATPTLKSTGDPRALPVPPAATLTPILLQPDALPDSMTGDAFVPLQLPEDAAFSPFGLPCTPVLSLTPAIGAMVDVTLLAPCNPREAVVLDHAGLKIEAETNGLGMVTLSIPAMDESATVSVSMKKGLSLSRGVEVPDARDFARVALLWEGRQVFSMHALELGARYGEVGHVWSGAPKTPDRAERGAGGFLTRFEGRLTSAEVYSYPIHHAPGSGVVRLTVAADVTAESCDRAINARALQTNPLGGVTSRDVKVAMPDCQSIGQTLRLKNLFQDMRLAAQ